MALAFTGGMVALLVKAFGEKISPSVWVFILIQTALSTLEIISSIEERATASEIGLMETTMKANGSLIKGLATATRNGLQGMFTKASG